MMLVLFARVIVTLLMVVCVFIIVSLVRYALTRARRYIRVNRLVRRNLVGDWVGIIGC